MNIAETAMLHMLHMLHVSLVACIMHNAYCTANVPTMQTNRYKLSRMSDYTIKLFFLYFENFGQFNT